MKTTGVVRRIDDLGRIVIPKEIRKTLRIKDGEYLQFFLDRENIVLQKYSPMFGLPIFYKNYVDSIYSEIGGNIIVSDRENIVAVAGVLKKTYLNKKISNVLDDIIHKREVVFSINIDNISFVDNIEEKGSYVIAPIISNGDAIGAVIIIFSDSNIDDFVIKTCSIASKFLGKYIE